MQFPRVRRFLLSSLLPAGLSLAAVPAWAADASGSEPHRLKRSEAFLGIHFDFHAGPDCTEVGKNTTRAMIEAILDQVKPDYLQIDCKGHPGFSSYPTKVGNPAPGFVGDPSASGVKSRPNGASPSTSTTRACGMAKPCDGIPNGRWSRRTDNGTTA
ncbi:MAG: hypothetical protein M5U12_23260 [Verrucomicrobia bacterium]|nr:hypothetical protein [Verrucomicrobiota bacterium]